MPNSTSQVLSARYCSILSHSVNLLRITPQELSLLLRQASLGNGLSILSGNIGNTGNAFVGHHPSSAINRSRSSSRVMDALPPDYVDHNLPLILLSGLGSDPEANSQDGITPDDGVEYPQLREGGVEIFSDFPLLTDSTAERVLNALLSQDATHRPWNARAGDVGYKIKRVGRVGQRSSGDSYAVHPIRMGKLVRHLVLVDLMPPVCFA